MIGAKYVSSFLKEKNIKHIFGYQGGAIAKILDEIYLEDYTQYIQNYHEQASAFGACGYAKTNSKIGVAIATSGPGAVNLLGGIADAYCDSVPCLFITGNDCLKNIKNNPGVRLNGFQDLNIVSIAKNITKYSVMIEDINDLPYELEKCYQITTTGRKGPVLIDIPLDIQFQETDLDSINNIKYEAEIDKNYELQKIGEVLKLLSEVKKPVILCGGGIISSNAKEEFNRMLNIINIPVVATSNGLGASEKIIGFSGLNGNTEANLAILNADLLIVFGARFGQQQVGKDIKQYTAAKIVHIDIDKNESGRVFKDSLHIYSDLKEFIINFNKSLLNFKLPDYQKWRDEVASYVSKYQSNIYCHQSNNPVHFIKEILKYTNNDTVMTLDVGQNQMWVSQAFKLKGEQKILSGVGYGSMGCSLPYAIGACYATENRQQIISFNGDGGLQMNIQELMLIADKQLNIKIVVFNNSGLGLIRESQDRYMHSRYFGTNKGYVKFPELDILSKAYGLSYSRMDKIQDCEKIINLFSNNKPCIVELFIDQDAKLLNKYDDYKNLNVLKL